MGIELLKHILVGNGLVVGYAGFDLLPQVRSERLEYREYNPPLLCIYRYLLHEVENTVGLRVQLGVEVIEVQYTEEQASVDGPLRDVIDGITCFVVLVEDVEHKIILVKPAGANRVDVLHHQVPGGQCRGLVGALKEFEDQGWCIGVGVLVEFAGEFTHAVNLTTDRVLKGNSQDLIGPKLLVQ